MRTVPLRPELVLRDRLLALCCALAVGAWLLLVR
jgi:hypothetical protein